MCGCHYWNAHLYVLWPAGSAQLHRMGDVKKDTCGVSVEIQKQDPSGTPDTNKQETGDAWGARGGKPDRPLEISQCPQARGGECCGAPHPTISVRLGATKE
ncbi:hypothetical protein NDU88_003805 [Pleurodeles waltl]|uniref:Uncharacterized protein n=1 Tax=Pleurodeles waltl TaxID=8319 RepID=A0AAV7PFN4_PLEWA|nr:hypothetical protein NDU88_003805 [Pleurodeles waltl]